MARKRMFDRDILETDSFADLSMSAKALYFLLGMEADDEGFVSPKRVLRIYGGNADDIKALIFKKFIIPFESGVVVITDWNENNYLDKNRIKETNYQEEKKLLALDKRKYKLLNNGLTEVKQMFNQERVGESRREEERIGENNIATDRKAPVAKEHIIKKIPTTQELIASKEKHIQIIGMFLYAKKIGGFVSYEEYQTIIKRNIRAARSLVGFENELLQNVMSWLTKHANFKWSLETVGKYAGENLDLLLKKSQQRGIYAN